MFKFFKNKFTKKSELNAIKRYDIKIGLALGGGATRGFAHIGALKAFEEHGIKFDFVAGTSVGSLVGAMYCAGKTVSEMEEIAKNVKEKDIRTSKLVFIPSKTTGIENLIISNLGDINIEELKIPFSPVVVDLKTTNEIALRRGNLAKAVAGSCAVPGVFTPVEFDDKLLADGGLQNAIPADIPKLFGCDYVVAIDVNPTRTYGTESSKLVDTLLASVRILMKTTPIKGYLYSDVMIAPNLKKFKATSIEGMDEMMDLGYKIATEHIKEILELFNKKPIKRKLKVANYFASLQDRIVPSGINNELLLKKKTNDND